MAGVFADSVGLPAELQGADGASVRRCRGGNGENAGGKHRGSQGSGAGAQPYQRPCRKDKSAGCRRPAVCHP